MAWTTADRRRYAPALTEMVRQGMLVRLARTIDALDPQPPTGRQRVWSSLLMLQALWHLTRDGCSGRRLPATLPPPTTVCSRRRRWRRLAVLERALAIVVACLRLAQGRKRRPSAAIIDTQTVPTRPQRGARGFDAHKKIKGRKRVLLVDSAGNPLAVRVVAADMHEHHALCALAPDLDAQPTLLLIWLDRGFAGDDPKDFLNRHGVIAEIVGGRGRKGFQVEPHRWRVEQTFGCLQRYRRLRGDDELSCASARAITLLAALFLSATRLERRLRP